MPPVNDDFASATVLTGDSGHVTFSNVGATTETGEPANAEGHSVWFKWTPSIDGDAYVRTGLTPLPDWDSYIAVHTGTSFADLVEVDSADDNDFQAGHTDPYGTSKVAWAATAGTTYWIQVTAWDDVSGPVERSNARLDWNVAAPGITSIAPTGGPVGTVVDVYGAGFASVTGVTINGDGQGWSALGSDHIQVTINPGTTTGYIVLARPGGDLTSPVQFAVGDPPTLDAFIEDENYSGYPAPGISNAGLAGDVLKLTGSRLNTVTDVFIGGAAASFTSEVIGGSTVLHATVPAGALTGTVEVVNSIGPASRPFTRLYPGPWVQPPSRWVRDFRNAEYYYLAWVDTTTVDAVPDEPATDFDGTVLTDIGDGTHRPIVDYTEPLYMARTSSDESPISLFSNAGHLDEWSFGVMETVFVLRLQEQAEEFGSSLMPATEPTSGELAPADVYSWQFEPGSLDTGGSRHGDPDPTNPILLDLDVTVEADDEHDYYYWDNQWRDELVNSDGWGLTPTPIMPFGASPIPLGDLNPDSPPRQYHIDIASSVPSTDTVGWQFTLQWVNDNSAAVAAHGDWITFAPTSLDFYDKLVTAHTGDTWDPAVTDPITVRVLRRPVGGGTITVMTTFPVVDARDYRTVAATDILTDVTMEWRHLPTGDYEPNPDDPGGSLRPVKKWYTSSELAAKDLLITYTADGDYAVAGETQRLAPYNRDAYLSRGASIPTPAGTPEPYVTAAENGGDDLFVSRPVLLPFTLLDDDGRLAMVAAPKRVTEWDWPTLPDYHRPAASTWYTDGDYWQVGVKLIQGLAPTGEIPGVRFAFKHKPPRYRLLYTTPQGRPPLGHRQRRDGTATTGPPLAHFQGADGTTRPPLAHRQNTP